MRDLDFLLGDFRAEWTNLLADPADTGIAEWNTTATFSGHAYEMTQYVAQHDVNGRFVFQWDGVNEKFTGYYYDDWGNRATVECAGWEDGHLAFVGECFGFGKSFRLKERFEIVDENHYVKRGFVQLDGADWMPADEIHCYRV
ncbi:hypothetical protein TU94_22515 [Streptomyces cyaneogriseus subsp. noncyanogenus]|uniref:NlmOI n=2 Tax=Streptomyces TaxID=1883 RepID=A0A0C5G753_9ACTN|nr:hypothetical protein TU94_22515 [Streptomyces cyaneogriseus subsp. noncyanogenus]